MLPLVPLKQVKICLAAGWCNALSGVLMPEVDSAEFME